MKEFNNLKEMEQYYNEVTDTYEFYENGEGLHVKFNFNLTVASNINAGNINARDIKAWNINAWNINAWDINVRDINARDINAADINARDIKAWNIKAWNISATDINAWNINATDINAGDIDAMDISYYAVCFAYKNIECKSIKGRRENSKHFCLDEKITFKKETHTITIDNKTFKISEERYKALKQSL